MAIITYPLNNIEYTAEDAELYHATRTSGVFANDDFPITVSGDGNVVTIGEGIGWIRNSKFSGKVVANKAEMSLDLGLPHATYPRIDAVVLQFNTNANSSEIIVKNGTAKTNPTPPEVVRTESVYELHLYHVYREAGAASVTASNVTDLRSDSAYCGIMADDVTMLGDDYVRKNMVGVANGVASLDGDGKVPKAQLPPMNYIPTSQKGAKNGVASLDSTGKVPSAQFITSGNPASMVTNGGIGVFNLWKTTSYWVKIGRLVVLYLYFGFHAANETATVAEAILTGVPTPSENANGLWKNQGMSVIDGTAYLDENLHLRLYRHGEPLGTTDATSSATLVYFSND